MVWIILTCVLGWLLCGAWAIRMFEKDVDCVEDDPWLFYSIGPLGLLIMWCLKWPKWICKFIFDFSKGIVGAFKKALNQ